MNAAIADRSQLDAQIEVLIKNRQYSTPQSEKEQTLLPLLQAQCQWMADASPEYRLFLTRLGHPIEQWQSLLEIPPLPVSMFKKYRLTTVPPEKIIRELTSSATTGQHSSRIFIDKTTSFRQTRALVSILKEHLGNHKRPLLVIDSIESAGSQDQFSARSAGIRGVANFASETVYALKLKPNGNLEPDWVAIDRFFTDAQSANRDVLLFGFTFMVWSNFLKLAHAQGIKYQAEKAIMLHSGGWKKLQSQAVTKSEFNEIASETIGCPSEKVLDFYGMAEQLGTVFVDCKAGNKHAPAFADIILRRAHTLTEVGIGEEGIIEIVSLLPNSYPGQALITEDRGVLLGIDDCPCGAKGKYFRFSQRIERVELRGCGDTFAQTREI